MIYEVQVSRTTTLTIKVEAPDDDRGAARETAIEQAVHFTEEQWKAGYTEVETTGCDPA